MPEIDLVGVVHDNDLYIEREMRCKRRGPGHRMQAIKTGLVSDYGPTKFAATLVRASSLAVDSDLPDSHKLRICSPDGTSLDPSARVPHGGHVRWPPLSSL